MTEASELPAGLTSMQYTFNKCGKLVKPPVLPDGIKNMTHAFADCVSLEKIIIPEDAVFEVEGVLIGVEAAVPIYIVLDVEKILETGVTFPGTGIYFMYIQDGGYCSKFITSEAVIGELKKIDKKNGL
jgi:hypothetical protein